MWCCVLDLLLKHINVLAVAEVFAKPQGFLFFLCCLPNNRLGVGNTLGRNTAEISDPNWPKGYSISYNIMLINKN